MNKFVLLMVLEPGEVKCVGPLCTSASSCTEEGVRSEFMEYINLE